MTPLAFFRTEPVARLLQRASRSAAMPIALHYAADPAKALRIVSFGQCNACAHVAKVPGGPAACRASRLAPLRTAVNNNVSCPFLCHMGLACLVVPALPVTGEAFTLTWGPYCPQEEPRALEDEVRSGLQVLDDEFDGALPFALTDIHVVPAAAVTSIVEWTLESLAELWQESQARQEPEPPPVESAPLILRPEPPRPRTTADPYLASTITAALAGGSVTQARALIRAAFLESGRATIAAKRARSATIVTSVIEAAEHASLDTMPARERLAAFLAAAEEAKSDAALVDAVMAVLGAMAHRKRVPPKATSPESDEPRKTVPAGLFRQTGPDFHAQLNTLLLAHLVDGITLNEVASILGQHPTAITHRLQRKFGMSFSEYHGRLRIEKAKELLRRTRLTVTEIGRRIGIDDVSNLGKLFRKFEGVSPLEYRAKYATPRPARPTRNQQKTSDSRKGASS